MDDVGSSEDWLRWLKSGDSALVDRARLGLGGVEPTDDIDRTPLIRGLASSDHDIVFWALVAIGRLGPQASEALEQVCNIARTHHEFGIRQSAAEAASRIGPHERLTVNTLLALLRDPSPYVRREALQALIAVEPLVETDIAAIRQMGADSDPAVARWSEIALRNIAARQRRLE
jgi:HEAT repeat protein